MSMLKPWKRRSVLLAGIALAGASLHNIAQQGNSRRRLNPSHQSGSDATTGGAHDRPLRIGWSPWADAEVVSLMAATLIKEALNQPVERVMADIGIQYQSLARGDLDLMLMAWLPGTHRDYWARVRDQVRDFGPMYTGRLGLVVPQYVPETDLFSIAQLSEPEIAARFDNRIQGIDPGSALNQATLQALKTYSLESMQLVAASSAVMAAVVAQAIADQRWLIATSWTPHWMFARYQLRFLADPQRVFVGTEQIHAIGRSELDTTVPAVAAFLNRFHLPRTDLDGLLLLAEQSTAQTAVTAYLEQNPARVRYWTTGLI